MTATVISLKGEVQEPAEHIEPTGEVCFENDGEIDVRSITMFGVSSKNEGAIGFFGTGLKYAIAILLREGCEITIYSGLEKFVFSKEKAVLRNKEFEAVSLNNSMLGFTTELGKTWELWKAYRELYCNCVDEYGAVKGNVYEHHPEAGKTKIYATGLAKTHKESSEFLLKTEPAFILDELEVHPKTGGGGIFYKGVKVHNTRKDCLYNYNIKSAVDLTEDRTARYEYQVINKIRDCALNSENKYFLEKMLSRYDGTFEGDIAYHDSYETPSQTFIEVAGRLGTQASQSAQLVFKKHALKQGIAPKTKLTAVQEKQLARAISFCKHLGYEGEYPIVVTDALGENVLGLAEGGVIYISDRNFRMGTKAIATAIYEEYVHLKHGYHDESRDMQNFLFDIILTQLEEKLGEAI